MVKPATLRDERGVVGSATLGQLHGVEVKDRAGCREVKGTYRVVNVKRLQCAGLVVTPKLSRASVYQHRMYQATTKSHLRKATKNVATEAYW